MSVERKQVFLRCDGIDGTNERWRCGFWIGAFGAAEARRLARLAGWCTGLPGGRDLCPYHLDQHEATKT